MTDQLPAPVPLKTDMDDTAIPPEFESVDQLAWIIVGDIFTANGIYVSEDEDDPLRVAVRSADRGADATDCPNA